MKKLLILSGKGGVGKSLVTSIFAVTAQRNGYRNAILDADITGSSIPKMFGIHKHAAADNNCIIPTKTEISIVSLNLLTEDETDPVIWREPMIKGVVKQF